MEQPLQYRQDAEPTSKRKRKRRRRCKRHPQEGPHSPTCRGHNSTNATNNGLSLVRILPRLKPILDFLDVKGDVFTRAQIMSHLTEYIKKKALYDPSDPRKVYCENDELGEIFGCKEFSTANVCELLLQNLEIVSTTNNSEPPSLKGTSCNSTLCCPPCKRTSLSTTDTCSCSESDQTSTNELPCSSSSILVGSGRKRSYANAFSAPVDLTGQRPSTSGALISLPNALCSEPKDITSLTEYSRYYQGICENATDVVTDTSDDLFFLYETDEERVVRRVDSDEERFSLEYEPISYSEEERLVASSGIHEEEELESGDTEVDEGEDGGDELGTSDSSDSEIEEDDKWQCETCSERNHPMTRRCRRCWAVRIDWYPTSLDRTTSDPGRIRSEMAQIDPAIVSDSASTSRIHTPLVRNVALDSTNVAPSEENDAYGRMKCLLCRKEPPNGCMIHGQTGHQVCCVSCARKLKENNKPCPVCRKKISKVIKNFM